MGLAPASQAGSVREHVAADTARMEALIRHARQVCAAPVGSPRAGGTFGAPVERVMLVGFAAGGLSSLLAADTPGVVGFVGLAPFDRTISGQAERLGLAAAGRLRTEALLLRAPPSRCNAEAVAAPWGAALPA